MALPLVSAALALAQFAPSIAKWIGGSQAEQVAEKIVGIGKEVTGSNDHWGMIQLLKSNPDMVVQLQNSLIEFESEMEISLLQDRQSARLRDMEFIQNGRQNIRADIMVVCAAGGLVSCLASIACYSDHLPGEAVGIISTIAGIFGSCLKDAYAFEFGSSRSSKIKDSTFAALLKGE